MMEARGLPISGFDSFDKAMEYSLRVTKAGFVDQSMVWNWVLVGLMNSRLDQPEKEFEFLNHLLDGDTDYNFPLKGMRHFYNWTQFRGYKEQVSANLDVCRRIAKEVGGQVLEDDELENNIGKIWNVWKSSYVDFNPSATQMAQAQKSFPSGANDIWLYIGKVDDLVKLEKGYNERLKEKYNISAQPVYTRVYEYGIGGHIRFLPAVDMADEKYVERLIKIRSEMHNWALDNYAVHCSGGYRNVREHSTGMGDVIEKIRGTLDPNHIMYTPGAQRLDPDETE
jgi:hypothetical protein